MGMSANRTSAPKTTWGRTSHILKNTVQEGAALTVRTTCFLVPKAFALCRDNLLSITVLLMFPVAIAGYYWSNSTSEPPQTPEYLMMNEEKDPKPSRPTIPNDESKLVSVKPEIPMTLDAPQTLGFPAISEGAEFSVPQPLPIDLTPTGEVSATAAVPPIPGQPPRLVEPHSTAFSAECVWLTGTIEELESSTDLWQNASRVHDLTGPSRN